MRTALLNCIIKAIAAVLLALLAWHWLSSGTDEIIEGKYLELPTSQAAPAKPQPAGPSHLVNQVAGSLVKQHHCWTKHAPKDMQGQVPGATVISRDGNLPFYSSDDSIVGLALNTALGNSHTGIRVHAFCR